MDQRQTVSIDVKGIGCEGCVKAVKRIISESDSKAEVIVDLQSGRVTAVTGLNAETLAAVVTAGGYKSQPAL